MKILITGGAGFIGCNLIRWIIENTEDDVVNVDKLTYAGNLASLKELENSPRYEFRHLDICDDGGIREVFEDLRPDAVMHLAAESHVDRSIDGPREFIQTNLVGTFTLLHAARRYFDELAEEDKKRFRFLHVSTDEVYGSLGLEDPAFSETTPYDPHSPYSASKAGSDHLARAWYSTYGLPVLITNCSNNYGPYQFPEKLIPVVILKALRGEQIPIYGKGENVRDWLYVTDHANALHSVLMKGTPGETYNIGGDNEKSNIELVRYICRILDELRPTAENESIEGGINEYAELITFVEDRPGHDLRYAIDASKIRDSIGWAPEEKSDSGLRKTVAWYLENGEWSDGILSGEYQLGRQGLKNSQEDAN